eukprot:gene11474-11570_t
MEQLLIISERNGKSVVSARDLWYFLDIKTEFSHWCKRMFEYGFNEGIDFTPILTESTGGRPTSDFALSIDCAKEISMIQRTEKGKQAREYFIACEKQLRSMEQPTLEEMTLKVITTLQHNVEEYKMRLAHANEVLLEQAPKVSYVNTVLEAPNLIPITIIAKDLGMSAKELNKLLSKKGVIFKQGETWYGVKAHTFEIITECTEEEMYRLEATYGHLYNVLGKKGLNCSLPKNGEFYHAKSDALSSKIILYDFNAFVTDDTRRFFFHNFCSLRYTASEPTHFRYLMPVFIFNGQAVKDPNMYYDGYQLPRDAVTPVNTPIDYTNNPSLITIGNGDNAISLPSDSGDQVQITAWYDGFPQINVFTGYVYDFLEGNQLYVNVASNTLNIVKYATDRNVIGKPKLQKKEATYQKIKLKAWFINENGTKDSIEIGDTVNGYLVEQFFYKVADKSTYQYLAEQALIKASQHKFNGEIETLLYPDCELFWKAQYTDIRYPSRTANYASLYEIPVINTGCLVTFRDGNINLPQIIAIDQVDQLLINCKTLVQYNKGNLGGMVKVIDLLGTGAKRWRIGPKDIGEQLGGANNYVDEKLNPQIRVLTPLGMGWAFFLIDYGQDTNPVFVTRLDQNDVEFDIIKRDIVMTGSGDTSDFVLTQNPSVQNGGILLRSKVAILNNPMYGIGLVEEVMGSHASIVTRELNRWKAQCMQDGATIAKWNASITPQGQLNLNNIEVMTPYVVQYGETIGDVIFNATGNIGNWSLILEANGFDTWTPVLNAGDVIIIPDTVVNDLNTLRQLADYPANNASVGLTARTSINGNFTELYNALQVPIKLPGVNANIIQAIGANTMVSGIAISPISGGPVTLRIGITANGEEILADTPINQFQPINAMEYFLAAGNLYFTFTSGAGVLNIRIDDTIVANLIALGFSNPSAEAIYNKFAEAAGVAVDNTITEIANSENIITNLLISKNGFGKVNYYTQAALAFQYGDDLIINTAINPDTAGNAIQLILKVATTDINGNLAPLSPAQLLAFQNYFLTFEILGLPVVIVSIAGELQDYIKQNVPGVKDYYIYNTTIDGLPFNGFTDLSSGYFNYDPSMI